jgi:O-Antigen ligase
VQGRVVGPPGHSPARGGASTFLTGGAGLSRVQVSFVALSTAIVAGITVFSPALALGLAAGTAALLVISRHPHVGLCAWILMTPFSEMAILNNQLGDVPGLKIPNILAVLTLAAYAISSLRMNMPRRARGFAAGMLFFLTVSVLRSLPELRTFNWFWEESMDPARYLLSHLVKPALLFLPFFVITAFASKRKDFALILDTAQAGTLLLSIYLCVVYLFFIPDKGDFEVVRQTFGVLLNMHGNELSSFFIVMYPLIFARLIHKRTLFNLAAFGLSVCSVFILYSRAAYLLLVFASILLLLLERRPKLLLLALAAVALVFILPSTVSDRATTSLGSGDLNLISANRVGLIWLPLITEYLHSPAKLIFGNGRYAVLFSDAARSNSIMQVGHAHNMYLDVMLDTGLVGLAYYLFSFLGLFRLFRRNIAPRVEPDLHFAMQGIFVSLFCYLISGVTDRSFMPKLDNSYLWILLAVGIGIVGLSQARGGGLESVNAPPGPTAPAGRP